MVADTPYEPLLLLVLLLGLRRPFVVLVHRVLRGKGERRRPAHMLRLKDV